MKQRYSKGSRLYPTTESVNTQKRVTRATSPWPQQFTDKANWILRWRDGRVKKYSAFTLNDIVSPSNPPIEAWMQDKAMRAPVKVSRFAIGRAIRNNRRSGK